MKTLILLVVFLSLQFYSVAGSLEKYFKYDTTHQFPSVLDVDAVFAINVHKNEFKAIRAQFDSYHIDINTYSKFATRELDHHLISKFCSSNVTPELLSEILSHLSLYYYCLQNGMSRVLIVNTKAQIKQSPFILNGLLKELETIDPLWDIFFTDVDYHNLNNGDIIVPTIVIDGEVQPNKKRVSANISQVLCRYGTISFIISHSGMMKILNALNHNWIDFPYDQILFRIPDLKCYGPDSDIITN